MRVLCEENGVELILMKAPTGTRQWYWYDQWDAQIVEYAIEHDLKYYNFLKVIDEIGLDYTTDTYDKGGHLNLSGAEKLTKYFGKLLRRKHNMTGHRHDRIYEEIWTELAQQHEQIKKKQEDLLAKNGKLTGFTGL